MLGLRLGLNNNTSNKSQSFILDDYSANSSFSFRQLSGSFSSDYIEVQRSTDDATQTFSRTEITDGTLESFCSGTDGLVKSWSNQSVGTNATQSTKAAMPKIVESGVLVTLNGLPALSFDGVDDFLQIVGSASGMKFLHDGTKCNMAIVFAVNAADTNTFATIFGNQNGINNEIGLTVSYEDRSSLSRNERIRILAANGTSLITNITGVDDNLPFNQQNIAFASLDLSNAIANNRANVYVNNTLLTDGNALTGSPSTSNGTRDYRIGSGDTFFSKILVQEVIIWDDDQSANRAAIETSINSYYSIY